MAQLRDLLVTGAARFVNGAYFGGASTFGSVTQPIWWNNGFPQATTYSLSATLNAGSANRLAYYSGTNVVSPSAHYASATQLGINITNASTIGSRSLYVNGTSYYYDTMEARTNASHLGLKLGSTYLNAIDGNIIFQNNTAIRFGGDNWDWNVWAGLKYVHSNKKIVLGLADGTEFTANAAQSGGTFKIVGMSTVDMNKTASITNLAIGGGIYWNPYVESASDGSDAASITVLKSGAAGGTELRIQQQNDANDIINLVASKWIYLNGKRAFTINDAWLRINEDNLFTEGIYTGQSIVRTDAQFQVGDSGSKFYANSSGNGYFSNTLGIAGTNTSYNLYINGTSRFNNTLYFFNSTGDTALSIESRRSKNSSNANIETITGLVTKNKSFIEIRGFAPPTMVRTTGDRPAPYGLGFGNGAESAGIMPIGEGDNLRELMFYGANSGPTLFTWKCQLWESTSYDTDSSNGYSAAMMSLNSKTGDLYVKHSIGINGTNVAYKLYVNGESYFDGQVTATQFNGPLNGNATSATYTTQLLGVQNNGSNTPYSAVEGNLIRAVWNVKGDNRWYLKAGTYNCRVNYADNADTLDGYHEYSFFRYRDTTSTNGAGTLWTQIGSRSYHNALPDGLSGVYNYGQVLTFPGNGARFEIYCSHSSSTDGNLWYRSGWNNDKRPWRRIIDSANIGSQSVANADKVDGLHATDFVRAYTTSSDNIDADWGQSFKTFDPIPTGTPPEQNPNISLLSIGDNFGRRKMFAFMYDNDNIYYRRRHDNNFSAWVKLLHSGNYNSYAPTLTGGGASGTWGISITGNANYLSNPRYSNNNMNTWNYGAATLYSREDSGDSVSNCPSTGAWWQTLCQHSSDANYGNQLAQQMTGGVSAYIRNYQGGAWSAWYRLWRQGDAVTSAVWNDYAECRKSDSQEPGYVMFEKGDDSLSKTIERLQHFAGIVSDTWGFSQGETAEAKTNIAVAGRVLAYPYRNRNEYKPGDCVCAAPGGTVDIMTREEIAQYPDRIVGTVSCVPDYEEWGGGEGADRDPVKVNGRIWIKVR